MVKLISGFFRISPFGIKTSFPSQVLICVSRKFSISTWPRIPLISTISPTRKGRLNAKMIPARKFSPISFSAKPMIKADIPAPASIPDITPVKPMIRNTKSNPIRITIDPKTPARKLASRSSSILFINLLLKSVRDFLARKIKIKKVTSEMPPIISQCFTVGQSVDKNSNSSIGLKTKKNFIYQSANMSRRISRIPYFQIFGSFYEYFMEFLTNSSMHKYSCAITTYFSLSIEITQ